MMKDRLTFSSVRQYLCDNLKGHYHDRELKAIVNIILSFISGKNNSFILANPDHIISSFSWSKVNKICIDLKNRMPVQYITGETEFYGIRLKVSPAALIPRQETEELADMVIKEHSHDSPSILDIGTGSGCIAISIALNIKGASISACDISEEALLLAASNAKMHSADIKFIKDNILCPDPEKYGMYDIIVSNPPYITGSEKAMMDRNILDYEPHEALFVPDNDALIFYRSILEASRNILNPGGLIYFEINEAKSDDLKALLTKYGIENIQVLNDINGKPRIVKGRKNEH